jgi:hypothetical protein
MYFVVTNERGIAHLVDAPNQSAAIAQFPDGQSVRIAHQVDIDRYHEQDPSLVEVKK